ncbi:MAG: hypothetical protein OQL20_12590 [Sedimenticola sp.]|nr:hypothetical protein [Sedimenticola sp.]
MQRFLLGALTLALYSNIAIAEGTPPAAASYYDYAPANSAMWRPQEQATLQQSEPRATQQHATPMPSATQSAYPQAIQEEQQYAAPYDNYGYQERYEPGYYAHPQPGYWSHQAYPTTPGYPSGYHPGQPYNYPYIYETAPVAPEYAVPQGYGYPQDMGYSQEYYVPAQPDHDPSHPGYYPPGYGTEYSNAPHYPMPAQPYENQQAPYQGYAEPSDSYPSDRLPPSQSLQQPPPYSPNNNSEWRPTEQPIPGTGNQQVPDSNGMLVNGSPAVFRPWTPPDTEPEQGSTAE